MVGKKEKTESRKPAGEMVREPFSPVVFLATFCALAKRHTWPLADACVPVLRLYSTLRDGPSGLQLGRPFCKSERFLSRPRRPLPNIYLEGYFVRLHMKRGILCGST